MTDNVFTFEVELQWGSREFSFADWALTTRRWCGFSQCR